MRLHPRCVFAVAIAAVLASNVASAGPKPLYSRLSLDPHAASRGGGARIFESAWDAPLRLPRSGGAYFSLGFTIPEDYAANTPMKVVILWETPSTGCSYQLGGNFLYLARDGLAVPYQSGNATEGFVPVAASTSFSLPDFGEILMQTPATAHQTASVTFKLTAPVKFPGLQAGDAVVFSIDRLDFVNGTLDTCTDSSSSSGLDELGVAGISVVYQQTK